MNEKDRKRTPKAYNEKSQVPLKKAETDIWD